MVVGFYSPMCLDVVPSLLALTFYCVLKENKDVLIINAVNNDYELESALGILDESLLYDVGLDYLFRAIKGNPISKENIQNACLSFASQKLHILSASGRAIKVYDKYVQRELQEIIEVAKSEYDYIFINLMGTKDIKEWDDVVHSCCNKVVISISQNRRKSEKYIKRDMEYCLQKGVNCRSKMVYLIDRYDEKSVYNSRNFSTLFPHITLGAIPYETEYYDAIYNSNVIEYMQKENVNNDKTWNSFFLQIEPVCNMILKEGRRG